MNPRERWIGAILLEQARRLDDQGIQRQPQSFCTMEERDRYLPNHLAERHEETFSVRDEHGCLPMPGVFQYSITGQDTGQINRRDKEVRPALRASARVVISIWSHHQKVPRR